jgi:hypothetical protein
MIRGQTIIVSPHVYKILQERADKDGITIVQAAGAILREAREARDAKEEE